VARLIPLSDLNEQGLRRVPAVVPSDPPFAYYSRSARERHPLDYAGWVGKRFPGASIPLLKLLIAAKGFAQRSASEPPRVLITGQSGGGKTAHVLLAAVMTGDTVGKLPIDVDPERFIRSYATEARRNGYVFSDEVGKSALKATDLCARLLHVSRETTYHQLYVGSTRVGRLAVHVMADTLVPPAMRSEVQLARRIVHADLGAGANERTVDWRLEGDITEWLTVHHTRRTNRVVAAHMLVSEVMDEVGFHAPYGATFEAYARRLGFAVLRDAADGVDADDEFRELFRQVLAAPDCGKGQWKGPGWKVFACGDESPLARAFRACVDGGADGDYQAVTGRQWGRLLDVPGLVCDVSPHRRQVGIRFRVGDPRAKDVRFNRAVLPAGHPLTEGPADGVLPFAPPGGPPAAAGERLRAVDG
jgi:hypothetical protein